MANWSEPYHISIMFTELTPAIWRKFVLCRELVSKDTMQTKVYENNELLFVAYTDVPVNEHDTNEIIDILNMDYQLELY